MGKPTRQSRGYDLAWERVRAAHIRRNPVCLIPGCGKKAEHVDHIETIRSAPHRRLDPTNLQSLCHAHHSVLTSAYDRGSLRGACDAKGDPIDPTHPWRASSNAEAISAANAEPTADPRLAARLKAGAARGRLPPSAEIASASRPPGRASRRGQPDAPTDGKG